MSDDTRIVFKRNLNALFIEKGSTQKELADFIGVHPSTINEWIKGRKVPRMDKIDKICTFFNVSREKLLGTPTPAQESSEDAALMELLFKNDPEMKKKIKNLHIDGTFTDGKKVCELSPESIARIKDAIRVSFAIDGQKGKAVVEIDE